MRPTNYPFSHPRVYMLRWSVIFLIIALIAALMGFGGVASAAASIAKVLFFIFLVLFVITLIAGGMAVKKIKNTLDNTFKKTE